MVQLQSVQLQSVIQDNLDLFASLFMKASGEDRRQYWEIFEALYSKTPEQMYGRAYNQMRLLKLALCFVVDEIAHYRPEDWEEGLGVLQDLYHDLKRRDAVCGFDEGKNEAIGDESIHNIQQMENLFHFQQVFSLLGCQKEFREQLADESVTGNPEINKDIVMELKGHAWGNHLEYESIEKDLQFLIYEKPFTGGRYVVQDFESIRENMGILPYNYHKIASKLERTLQRWAKIFPEPRLADLYLPKQKVLLPKLLLSTTTKPKPRRKKKGPAKSQIKSYIGRRAWTDEEKTAIQEGIQLFGKGQWSVIKAHFKEALTDRTSMQIKDCHRTLEKHGKILIIDHV